MKENWKPGTMVYPIPAVLVSCGVTADEYNLATVAWTGTINSEPPMCYISLRKSRYSHDIIERTGEFTINLTTSELARATDWCGVKSGRDVNKWEAMKLTPEPGVKVKCPYVKESPLSIECKVREIKTLGSHDMFIADVVNVIAETDYINSESGAFDLDLAKMLVYCHGAYYQMGRYIGKFGWSVNKKNIKKTHKKTTKNAV